MTDNIINDLENVRYHLTASKHKQVIDDAIDLINRQQAEIERLNSCVKSEDEVRAIMKAQMEPMVKAITNEQIDLANKCGRISGILEFSERLKEMLPTQPHYHDVLKRCLEVVHKNIDNLVKEMVGEG